MVSFEESGQNYNDDIADPVNRNRIYKLSSGLEGNAESENSLGIQPPRAKLPEYISKHQNTSRSSHKSLRRHRKDRDYERKYRRKEITDKSGRYNKEQLCMEELIERSRLLSSDKRKRERSTYKYEDRSSRNSEKMFSRKRSHDSDEDSYNFKSSRRHTETKYEKPQKGIYVLQDEKTEYFERLSNIDSRKDSHYKDSMETAASPQAENNTAQILDIKNLPKTDNEIETLERQRRYIRYELEKHAELKEENSSDNELEINYIGNLKGESPCIEKEDSVCGYKTPVESSSILDDNILIHNIHQQPQSEIEENDEDLSLSHSNDDNCTDSQVNDIIADNDLPPYYPAIQGCRSVNEFHILNHINEGTYGVVYRARDKQSKEIVALKRLKMEKENEGFPVTSLREINTLLKGQHLNIVTVREIVMGSNLDKIFIVMDYIEHDLKSLLDLMKRKKQTFTPAEVKCLLRQLLCAVAHLHDNWILHRDLKTSNILLSHNGILKLGDFGLAREYGSPLKPYTPLVVTLWYRAPELLLGAKQYSTSIDVWSVGCIFGELVLMNPIFQGKSEIDQIFKIFRILGTPNESIWPGYNKLPAVQKIKITKHPVASVRSRFHMLSVRGQTLLEQFLTYDPSQRITAEDALQHPYFTEFPLPIDPSMFPTWPAKSELDYRPAPGPKLSETAVGENTTGFRINAPEMENRRLPTGGGFNLKF